MKKAFALLLALSMLLAGCGNQTPQQTAPAETATAPAAADTEHADAPEQEPLGAAENPADAVAADHTAADYYGMWQDSISQRASLSIAPSDGYGDAEVLVSWGDGAQRTVIWKMYAAFDQPSGAFRYFNGEKSIVSWADDGTEHTDIVWNDGEGTLFFNKAGELRWEDTKEDQSRDTRFVKPPMPAPSTEDFVDGYFRVIGGYQSGTAGASLAEAKAAYGAMAFAYDQNLLSQDIPAFRDAMLAAWESMSEEERNAFDANFMDVVRLLDSAMEQYAELPGVFADAGVADSIKPLLNDSYARACWRTLRDHTLTMGNSES